MHITLVTAGSRGDIDPYLALGLGLRAAGHRVRLASAPEFAPWASARGLDFFAFRGSLSSLTTTATGQDASDPGLGLGRWLRRLRQLLRRNEPFFRGVIEDCWAACQGSDLVVASPFGFAAPHVTEKLGIPCLWGLLQPLSPTRAFPFLLAPSWLRGPGLANLFSYRVASRVAWLLLGPLIEDWRRRQGLASLSRLPLLARASAGRPLPVLYAFSPALVPRPAEWREELIRITGYWFLDEAPESQPAAGLVEFLGAGSRPIYLGAGGIRPADRERFEHLALAAVARLGRRAVLFAPGGGCLAREEAQEAAGDVYRLQAAVPHSWLLPQMAGAVHHGGAGTTGAALRAGTPSLVVPGAFDQYGWARRVAAAGAGPAPLPASRLTLDGLVRGIEALDGKAMRERAAEMARQIAREDGVGAAVAAIDQALAGRS
jgi:sterol 3beta-glucosyltransferase